jgi:hypothetical protein
LQRRHPGQRLFTATKVPPKDRVRPGKGTTPVDRVFAYERIIEYTDASLKNIAGAVVIVGAAANGCPEGRRTLRRTDEPVANSVPNTQPHFFTPLNRRHLPFF